MSKYSLQMECLESIEAFSDEQMSREMAVIESVLEIYDKAILMMELSNKDIDIPDCSMFMESTFYQEVNETQSAEQQQQQGSAPADGSGDAPNTNSTGDNPQNNSANENKTENKPMTEEERKAHNKEHWVRQTNKKGNVENIFISIIAFIPRLLGFLIQSVVRFFKKLGNKDTENKAKDLAATSSNDRESLAKELGDTVSSNDTSEKASTDNATTNPTNTPQPQPQDQKKEAGSVNVLTMAIKSYYSEQVRSALNNLLSVLGKLDITKSASYENLENPYDYYIKIFNTMKTNIDKELPSVKQSLEEAFNGDLVEIAAGDAYANAMNNVTKVLQQIENTANNVESGYNNLVDKFKNAKASDSNITGIENAIAPLKTLLKDIKGLISHFNTATMNFAREYDNYTKNVSTIWNVLKNNNPTNTSQQQPQNQNNGGVNNGQQNQQRSANNGGGGNNG